MATMNVDDGKTIQTIDSPIVGRNISTEMGVIRLGGSGRPVPISTSNDSMNELTTPESKVGSTFQSLES